MWRWAVVLGLVQVVAIGQQQVPFVGCPGDGQLGPIRPPAGKAVSVNLPLSTARQLAYYAGSGLAVLAPRGWTCVASISSSGYTLIVSRSTLKQFPREPLAEVISVSYTFGGSSGRYDVAGVVGQAFRDHIEQAEQLLLGFNFEMPTGPMRTDVIVRKSETMVEFKTPAGAEGLGTRHWIGKDSQVEGAAILRTTAELDLLLLSVKLPERLRSLTPHIIQHFEQTEKELGPR